MQGLQNDALSFVSFVFVVEGGFSVSHTVVVADNGCVALDEVSIRQSLYNMTCLLIAISFSNSCM